MPGYGQSSNDLDHSDPFGDLAFTIRAMLDELAAVLGLGRPGLGVIVTAVGL